MTPSVLSPTFVGQQDSSLKKVPKIRNCTEFREHLLAPQTHPKKCFVFFWGPREGA